MHFTNFTSKSYNRGPVRTLKHRGRNVCSASKIKQVEEFFEKYRDEKISHTSLFESIAGTNPEVIQSKQHRGSFCSIKCNSEMIICPLTYCENSCPFELHPFLTGHFQLLPLIRRIDLDNIERSLLTISVSLVGSHTVAAAHCKDKPEPVTVLSKPIPKQPVKLIMQCTTGDHFSGIPSPSIIRHLLTACVDPIPPSEPLLRDTSPILPCYDNSVTQNQLCRRIRFFYRNSNCLGSKFDLTNCIHFSPCSSIIVTKPKQ